MTLKVNFDELGFGVEVEFSGITRLQAAKVLVNYFGSTFVKYEGRYNEEFHIPDHQGRIYKIVMDGSIDAHYKKVNTYIPGTDEYKCEMVTPVLQYSDLSTLLEVVAALKLEGAMAGANCGVHIHIDASLFTAEQLRVLCNLVYRHQSLLTNALSVRESRKEKFCADLTEGFIEKLNRAKPRSYKEFSEIWYSEPDEPDESRYRIINLSNLLSGRFKAVEFRLFNSSLEGEHIKAYVQLCLIIVTQALRQKKALTRIAYSDNEKYTFRLFLIKSGAIGQEFRGMRLLLLKFLEGDSGRRHPSTDNKRI
ncbi:virulence associated protein [Paenibacillus antibioticophila]|uniref:Virulence associated protein n=1 Tax=Paenibacillus antibioticophila TaxID=1274374 RepID=A0A920CDD2_9BACL|nr:amidoligase family protein [Paenibacillus antibioticophila]GIO35726.1 virulence associated protein [Paenibacillus antibioticophila]